MAAPRFAIASELTAREATSLAEQPICFILRFTHLKIVDFLITIATHLSWRTNSQCLGPFGGYAIEDVVLLFVIVSMNSILCIASP